MATVYLGRASGAAGFEKVVAIKIIHAHLADEPDFLEMFFDEARIAAQIRHPHVVEILDLGSENGRHYMAMEWVEGETLSALVRAMRPGALPINVTLQVLADTLEGIVAAHEATDADGRALSLVHRDVSPQNLLISMAGWVKVTDFGIVKAAGRHGRTRTGELRGKVAYMSPEQARGLSVDARSDLFAVGVIAWELLHAERLFARATDAATLERVIACEVPAVSDEALRGCDDALAVGLRKWVAKALERAPDDRFEDARSMLDELKALIRLAGTADARATLSSIMKSEFGERLAYVRAALREPNPGTVALPPEPSGSTGPVTATTASTSLSAGISEATGLGTPKRAWAALLLLPLLGAAAAVAIATATGGLGGGRDAGEAKLPETAAAPPTQGAAVQPTHITWIVNGEPAGASVSIDGVQQVQPTPTKIALPRSETPVEVIVQKEGMQPWRKVLSPLADQNVSYELELLPAKDEGGNAPPSTGPAAKVSAKKRRTGPTKIRTTPPKTAPKSDPPDTGNSGAAGFKPEPDFGDEGE
jgi:serine/threonine-protein kinase